MTETVTYYDGDEGVHIIEEEEVTSIEIHTTARKRADSIFRKMNSVVTYAIDDKPPWYSTIMLAFQHFLTMFSSILSTPLVLAPYLCIRDDLGNISKLMATTFFVCGWQTFLQATFGVRLPIVQGTSFTFILPLFSMMNLRGECPVLGEDGNTTVTEEDIQIEFQTRMQQVQGAILMASLFEILLGFSGVICLMLHYIGPLTITPTIGLIGLTLFDVAAEKASVHWGIAAFTIILVVLFSQYLERWTVPCAGYSKTTGCHVVKFPLFRLFPIILAIMLSWFLCFILTVTNVFPDDTEAPSYKARTDISGGQLANTSWFYIPYPGQWGLPTLTAGGSLGMLAGSLASVVESIGDYYACARLSGAPPPPSHAVNRGIGMEGIGCLLSGLWGTGVGTTSYSENIGAIGITKVGSRLVIQVMSIILLATGVFLKVAGLFATIPEPVIGGILSITFGMVAAVGISNLQFVDMNSPRNLFIVGFSFYIGMAVPAYLNIHPDVIHTGSETFDQIVIILLRTSMFIGGAAGFILDNTIPGTPEERGITTFREMYGSAEDQHDDDDTQREVQKEVSRIVNQCYDMPFGMAYLRKWTWTSYLPFSPTFKGFGVSRKVRQLLPKRFRREKIDNV